MLAVPATAHADEPSGGMSPAAPALDGGAAAPASPPAAPTTVPSVPARPTGSTAGPDGRPVLLADGTLSQPVTVPLPLRRVIRRANKIVHMPYKWGGGHARARDTGYDCSGAVSWALGDMLGGARDSTGLMRFGVRGRGQWLTVYASRSHAYMEIAGWRLDTSRVDDPSATRGATGPRWRPARPAHRGFVARTVTGF